MLTILRGEYASGAANARADQSSGLVLRTAGDWRAPVPWGALRTFIAQGRATLGDERVRQAVSPRRAMLSLALRGLGILLDQSEQRYRAAASGLVLGELLNAILRDTAMHRAWQGAMGDLF